MNSLEDNVEVISLKGDASNDEYNAVKETSFNREKLPTPDRKRQPIPPPRRRLPLDKVRQDDWCATGIEEKPATPRTELPQRLALPHLEVDRLSRGSVSLGSRRQSVGGASVGSLTSQSDTRSYRERLRDHIQSVKEQAGTSIATANARLRQNLKTKSPVISNFHDLLGREESEVEAALEKHREMRKKWKNVVHASLEAETAHNFFTKEWEDDESIKDTPASPKGKDIEGSEGEETKLVTKDYLGLADDWQQVDCYVEPTIEDLTVRLHQESQVYYYPSDQTPRLEDKLGPDREPRYIEDEGFYVSPKPVWSEKSYNKLQHRLIREGKRHWFGDDGELKTVLVPEADQSSDPLLVPVYRNAELMNLAEPTVHTEPVYRQTYMLELEVASVVWYHHPLCSREHVAAHRLRTCYQEYSGRLHAGFSRRLASKLKALRTARDNFRQASDIERFERYKIQVKETREMRLEAGKRDRLAIVNCLKAWLELRNLRARQGYTVTSVKLSIVELETDRDDVLCGDPFEWDTELKCQLEECFDEEEEEYKMKLKEFKEESPDSEDAKVILRKTPSDILEEVRGKLLESLRPPGEPVIALELGDEPVTPEAEITDCRELERRQAQKQCQLSIRVMYNNQVVCRSRSLSLYPHFCASLNQVFTLQVTELAVSKVVCRSRSLSLYPHFCASLNQVFTLQVTEWPKSIVLQLVVQGGLGAGKRLTASVFVPVPPRNLSLSAAPIDVLEFNSPDKIGPFPHKGVGCGGELYAGGRVTYRAGWGASGGPPHGPTSLRGSRRRVNSVSSMREWAVRAQLDPNDPANADLFDYIKAEDSKGKSRKDAQSLPDGDFCTMEEIENNPRLKLLSLRNNAVPEFRDIRNIPLRDREIPDDIFKVYEKRTHSPLRSGPGVGETQLEWQREWSRQQLAVMRDDIVQHCRQTQQQHTLREVVMEDQVPDIGTLGLTFMKWLQPKRPLRPTRKERKKLPVMGLVGQEVEVIVNVVRAFEVPVRMDMDPLLEDGLSLVPVRPFVEVSFQGRKSRTTTAEGANPTWNQDLRIPVKLPSSGLYEMQDKLYCQLYDETVVDLLEDDRQRETNIHQRLQRQWLGSLHIPFSSLFSNPRIEGTFQLYSPPVLLGYQRESQHRQVTSASATTVTSGLRDSTFLTLFITVHPPLHPPEPFKEHLPCSEMPYLEQHLEQWQAQVATQFPHRPVKCLVVDTSAKSVCVTRFFQPLAPPVLEEGQPTTAEMAVRFVSKIPMVPGSMLFPGLFDVWLTAQQVVSLLSGDSEDHAVLLCCYLLHLGLRTWLVLGSGVPHGSMAMVLTRNPDPHSHSYTLWDPATSQHFDTQDSFCPLHRVYCLINQDNIWANIQREEVVSRTRFDVNRRGDWWPAFNRSVAAPPGSVQPAQLEYTVSPTLATDASLLQDKLEKTLRDSITKWRPTTRTVWNRYVTVKLRKLLPGLEKATWASSMSVSTEHISQLTQTLTSHKMCGFTQNFSFTSIDEIMDAVRATGIHTNEDPDVEFALAVYVHPFVCGVLSVWVYVTSLTVRR